MQGLPRLLDPAADAIRQWEADVETRQRSAFEARFIELWEAGDEAAALQVGGDVLSHAHESDAATCLPLASCVAVRPCSAGRLLV